MLHGMSFHHLPESVCSFIQVLFKTVVYVLCTLKCIINDKRLQCMTPWYWFLTLYDGMHPARKGRKKCYFTFPKPGEPLHLHQLLQDWQPYSALLTYWFLTQLKFPLPKLEVIQESPAPSSVTDMHSCICHMLLLSLVLFPWLLTTAASNINGQRHRPAARVMLLIVNITNKPDLGFGSKEHWLLSLWSVTALMQETCLVWDRIFLKSIFTLNRNV